MDWFGFALIVVLVLVLAPVLAVIALARVSGLERKVDDLAVELKTLRQQLA